MKLALNRKQGKPEAAAPPPAAPHADDLKPPPPPLLLITGDRSEPDMIERLFAYVLAELPEIPEPRLRALKAAVRAELGGEKHWIPKRPQTERQRLIGEVFAMFDGRNATEVARRLGIGRATVYRILKQPGKG